MSKLGYKQTKEQKEKTRQIIKEQWKTGIRKGGHKVKDTSNMKKAQIEKNKNPEVRRQNGLHFLKRNVKKWKTSLSESKKKFYQTEKGELWIKKYSPIISKSVLKKYSDQMYYKKFVNTMRNSKVWQGGKSFEIYPAEFKKLKKLNMCEKEYCQFCLRPSETFEKKLVYHHIDYNKKNNDISNFVRLCTSCHSKTNFDREKWEKFFKQLKKAENKEFKNKIIVITATRPDTIKTWPLIKKAENKIISIHTGQQRELSKNVFDTLDFLPTFDLDIMKKNQSLAMITSNVLNFLSPMLYELKPSLVLIHGDTTSSFSAALCSCLLRIPSAHLEAGLRTYDKNNPFPEEDNRILIDSLSTILFAPTKKNVKNLKLANITNNVYEVGNLIIDAVEMIKPKLPKERPTEEKYVLATVHRRESFGEDILEIFKALKELSKTIKIVLPAHPNPNVQKVIKEVGLEVVKPMNYVDFLWHLRDCEYVISDSGGVQEEAPSFNKKVIVLRKTTERQEVIEKGYGVLVPVLTKEEILKTVRKFTKKINIKMKNPFGNGDTADKIMNILNK